MDWTFSSLIDIGMWIGLASLIVLAIIRGWLVPGRTVDRLIASYDKVIDSQDRQITDWRETSRINAERADLTELNQRRLMESHDTLVTMLRPLIGRLEEDGM